MEYTVVQDNDCHRYIIPFEKMFEWNEFMEIPGDDDRSWDVPAFAERINGTVLFKDFRVL